MKARLTFICGGSWSGKTERASNLATASTDAVWVGTALPTNPTLSGRLTSLKSSRPATLVTYDCPFDLVNELVKTRKKHPNALLIIDSISQWLGNEIAKLSNKHDEQQLVGAIEREIEDLCLFLDKDLGPLVVVSSDFGASPPPQDQAIRVLRMCNGRANQAISKLADRIELMMAGVVFSSISTKTGN